MSNIATRPLAEVSTLRLNAEAFAVQSGVTGPFLIKVKENRAAALRRVPAWDVFIKTDPAKRGRCIGTMLAGAA